MNNEDLARAVGRLKKVNPDNIRDKSKPSVEVKLDDKHFARYQEHVLETNAERWVDLLGDFTFKSYLVNISVEDANEFVKAYEASVTTTTPELMHLQETVDAAIQHFLDVLGAHPEERRVFAKLSSRSAKDTCTKHPRVMEFYWDCLKQLKNQGWNVEDDNTRIAAMFLTASKTLSVASGQEVIEMFLRSGRVYQDLTLALDHLDKFQENVILRQWAKLDPSMEFRTFISKRRMTAVSQYFYHVFYESVYKNQDEILAKLQAFWKEQVDPVLASNNFLESYVVDFGILEDGTVIVIEINPFLSTTDAAMFSWEIDEAVLINGRDDGHTDFRVRDKPPKGFKVRLTEDWRKIVELPVPSSVSDD
eukprot:TRINITY_DN38455_c1_g1_i1.p1 TRINITY_DN38455_c1_g1~~TRINITY_DN38455_c1_g1_i1.p1  ORF type:complete len:372 (-),score=92.40 TRINITY_DN38455_c1_g1_i1:87-1175(-)